MGITKFKPFDEINFIDPRRIQYFFDDLDWRLGTGDSATSGSFAGWVVDASGSSALVTSGNSFNAPQYFGTKLLNTGTTTSGRSAISRSPGAFYPAVTGGVQTLEFDITPLTFGTRMLVYAGMYDDAFNPSNGWGIYLDSNAFSGRWQACAIDDGSYVVADTGVAPSSANRASFKIVQSGASTTFFINGNQVAELTSGTSQDNAMGLVFAIAAVTGTTNRSMLIDYVSYKNVSASNFR